MNRGALMRVDTPASLKSLMRGEILEFVCDRVRDASAILRKEPAAREVQAFGDRIHVVVDNAASRRPGLLAALQKEGVRVAGERRVEPSLENVFISLLGSPGAAGGPP